ncbi:Bug family tripartite tricarboxylate transporter substrate binding protein [Bordetella sp. 02P26C-1]|uniref:Bug family tripartite tricarboxylate transporter substrate binding protein n=1 Tax=Bordetella sp. 02P26C-1 TaxID=2683195 RepID=UPI0013542CC6|nr:tripartite tricarboxylate transporter substrate binding protein [Bordetella sp. 02P26C-1]MVW79634.1 tripartite tricarboxylate transporter substrate binding protein [Bordetella sp. 02P26C-1]
MKLKSLCITAFAAALTALTPASQAAVTLNGPVKLVVTFGAGSGGDVLARSVAQGLSERIKVPVVVENLPGAGGNIGAAYVARSKPDGQTLLLVTPGPLVTNRYLYKTLNYNPEKDLAPVAFIGTYPNILTASPQSNIKTLDQLLAAAKETKGGLSYASSGVGTTQHLAGELLAKETGANLVHVPYKATSAYVTDLAGGQLPLAFVAQAGVGLINEGKIIPIAVTSKRRSETLPQIPTFEELGLKGYSADSWFALAAAAATPPEVIDYLNHEINEVIKTPAFQEKAKLQLIDVTPMSPSEFKTFIDEERGKWTPVIKNLGISFE